MMFMASEKVSVVVFRGITSCAETKAPSDDRNSSDHRMRGTAESCFGWDLAVLLALRDELVQVTPKLTELFEKLP